MQNPDINVLVSAFRADSEHHARCRDQLTEASAGRGRLSLSERALSSALRVLTRPRVFPPPTLCNSALAFLEAALARPRTLRPGGGRWCMFRNLAGRLGLTDAGHAALAKEDGCDWVMLDRGFSIFPGLRLRNLLDD